MNKIEIHNQNITDCHKRITIGFIFNHPFFLGGGEISFFELIRTIDKERFKPIVIVPASGEIERKLKYNDIHVHSVSFPSIKDIINFTPLRSLFNLIKFLKEHRIDIIHINGSRVCIYGGIAGRILKIPVIWHVRESITDRFVYDCFLATLANAIVCVSKSVQLKRFGRFGQRVNKKISIVYNGVDTNRFKERVKKRNEVRAQLSLEPFEILIGLIGNIIPRKAQDIFLKGFAKAKQLQPDIAVKVLLIGRHLDKQFSNYLRKLVTDFDLHSNVIFQEFSYEIPNIFSGLDIFALSSKSEGFCRSLLEAMSCGLPIIASKIEEIEEAVIDKKNAILVDINDTNKMAFAIIKLCADSSLRKEIGMLNRNVAVKQFSLSSHTSAIESIYGRLFDERRSALR
jgi:glycosyltransferase involved in cell wall biosynthesis